MSTSPTTLAAGHSESSDPTEARLIEAARQVFAENGFQAATIREICARANANVAAVNYHFGDKAGLYLAVMRNSLKASMLPEPRDAAAHAATPEEGLRLMIAALVRRMQSPVAAPACHFRIMAHEMAQPTELLPRVVEEVMRPNYAAMREVVARILNRPADDDLTRLCAHSILGQALHYAHAGPVLKLLWPDLQMTPERVDAIAAHIGDFSLYAIQKLKVTNSHE